MANTRQTQDSDVEPWPDEDQWNELDDFGWCDYYLGIGTCIFGCQEEPSCHTDRPRSGWAVDLGGFDGLWTFAFAYGWALRYMVHQEDQKAGWDRVRRLMERAS